MIDLHRDTIHNAPRLFPTSAELGCPPVSPRDADLSRIRVLYPETMEEYDRLHQQMEADRKARRQSVAGDLAGLVGAEAVPA